VASPGILSQVATNLPRIGLDFVLDSRFTLGGGVGIAWVSGKAEDSAADADGTAFLISPRIGYVVALSPSATFWARGGISYFSQTIERGGGASKESLTQLQLNIEPTFAFEIVPTFGITVSAFADIPLAGETEVEFDSFLGDDFTLDARLRTFGVSAGFFAAF
jgi:hypothetical protein